MTATLPTGCYVMLHIGTGPSRIDDNSSSRLIVTDDRKRFELSEEIWIERLDGQLAKHIQKACEPPHYNISHVEQDRHLYAFVRRVPEIEKTSHEGRAELFATVALSRLIRPTSTGERYCTKVFHFGLPDSAIQAIQPRGMSVDVVLGRNPTDWLSVEDGEQLRKLMPWLSKDKPMQSRVHRAYWYHEYAMRSYYLDARWTLVVSGLEALINVDEDHVTRQFCGRGRQLADEFQVDLTDQELRHAYRLRSKLVHAETFLYGLETVPANSEHSNLYEKLELLLRATIRRCLLDEGFGNFFRDDAAVKARWPA